MLASLESEEKKNKRIGMIVSAVVHALLLLLIYFVMAWKPQIPPPPEYGIEMNFGTSDVGSGDISTRAQPNDSEETEDSKPAPEQPEVQQVQPQPTPPVERNEPVRTTTAESDVSVKEEVKPAPTPKPVEEKKPIDQRAVFPGKSKTNEAGTGEAGKSNKPAGGGDGDDNVKGNKGSRDGDPNTMGRGRGGSSLDMPGWRFEVAPATDPYENESGRIVFRITINNDGEIERIERVESNVSGAVERWYRDQLYKTTFIRTTASTSTERGATGTVTIIIRSR